MTAIEQLSHAEVTPAETGPQHGALGTMAIGALGVVYGDIGTSPLYTFKTAIEWAGGEATPAVALGILSLVVWTLIITTSIKYVAIVMRADNDGEGGILALMSLLGIKHGERAFVISLGIIGAAMLYGDGAITPAISVLSALEGIKDPLPSFAPYVLPLSVVVLLALFALQPQGTARIGALFGPIMAIWFITIGILGIAGIAEHQGVLAALDPRVGLTYLFSTALPAFWSSAACSCARPAPKLSMRTWAISARRRYG
jgi:KUP system potassium uptake protein